MAKMPDEFSLGARPSGATGGGIVQYQIENQALQAVPAATSNLGTSLSRGQSKIWQAVQVEQDRVDTLRAEDAYNKLITERMRLTYDKDAGFLNVQGADAVKQPLVENYSRMLRESTDKISSELGNESQREKFAQRAEIAQLQFTEDALRHTAKQRQVYEDQTYEASMATSLQAAQVAWASQNDVMLEHARIRNLVADRAESMGWGPETIAAEELARTSSLHQMVIGQALANGQPKYAEDWFNRFRDEIDPKTAAVLAGAVADGEVKERFNELTRRFILGKGIDDIGAQQVAMESLSNEVLADQKLDDQRKNTLLSQIQARVERLSAQRKAIYDSQMKRLGGAINQVNSATLEGFPASPEQLQSIVDAAKGTEMEYEANRMMQTAQAVAKYVELTPAQQGQVADAYERQLAETPNQGDIRVLQAMRTIHDNNKKLLETDPASWTARKGLLPPVRIDLAHPETQQEQLGQLYANAQVARDQFTAPYKPLPNDQADILKQILEDGDWQSQADYIGRLWQGSAGNTRGYMGIMDQIAGEKPVIAMAGERYGRGDKSTAVLMLRGREILSPRQGEKKPQLPMPPEQQMQEAFSGYVEDAYAGRPGARQATFKAAKAIYAAMVSDAGLDTPEQLDTNMWKQAMALAAGGTKTSEGDVVGGVVDWNGAKLPLPTMMSEDQFQAELPKYFDAIAGTPGVDPSVTPDRLRDAQLVPGPRSGTYAVREGNRLLYRMEPDDARRGELGYLQGSAGQNQGKTMTEYSITVQVDGKWINVPTLVQGQVNVEDILAGKPISKEQQTIAVQRALAREKAGATLPYYDNEADALAAAESRTEREKMIQGGERPVPVTIDMNQPPPSGRVAQGRVRNLTRSDAQQESQIWTDLGMPTPPRAQPPQAPPATGVDRRVEKFTPQSTRYDYQSAEAAGLRANKVGHWPTVAPLSEAQAKQLNLPPESGLILKGRKNPSWDVGIAAEYIRGNTVIKEGDRYYSVPWAWAQINGKRAIYPVMGKLPADVFNRYDQEIKERPTKAPKPEGQQ